MRTLMEQAVFRGNDILFNDPLVRFFDKPKKYILLSEREAWQEHNKGTPLFFGDGPADKFQIEGQGDLIGIDYCASVPFHATVPNCNIEWFCNCWKEAK